MVATYPRMKKDSAIAIMEVGFEAEVAMVDADNSFVGKFHGTRYDWSCRRKIIGRICLRLCQHISVVTLAYRDKSRSFNRGCQ